MTWKNETGSTRGSSSGCLWGIAGLTNTSLLAFLPASGLWVWYRRWKRGKVSLAGVALASLVFVLCVTPWVVRNSNTFGRLMFLRSNFGAELRIGNGPWADGTWREYLHPTQNVYEMRRYRQMGEIAYVAERQREAMAFIREDYARFMGLNMKRFIYYWGGVPRSSEIPALAPIKNSVFLASSVLAFWGLGRALRKRKPGAWLFFWLILSYPALYYVVFPHPRYRHPIEPELGILMVYVISEAEKRTVPTPQRTISIRWIVLLFGSRMPVIFTFWPANWTRLFLIVEAVNLAFRRQYEIASQVADAVSRAGAFGAARSLGFQHLGMRPCQRVDVESTLGIGDLPVKNSRLFIACMGQQSAREHPTSNPNPGPADAETPHGTTTNLIFMPSCSSLQITVQTTTYSPGSAGAVS